MHGTHLNSVVMYSRQGSNILAFGAKLNPIEEIRVRSQVSGIVGDASSCVDWLRLDEVHHN